MYSNKQCNLCGSKKVAESCQQCTQKFCSVQHLEKHLETTHNKQALQKSMSVQSQLKPSYGSKHLMRMQDSISVLKKQCQEAQPDREMQIKQEIVKQTKKLYPQDSPEVQYAMFDYAKTAFENSQLNKCKQSLEELLKKALKIDERQFEEQNAPFAIDVLALLGNCYLQLANPQKAVEAYSKCEQLLYNFQELNLHVNLSALYMNKGLCHFYLGNLQTAENLYNKAIKMNEHILGDNQIMQLNAKIQTNLAVLYDSQNLIQQALVLYQKALKTRSRFLNEDNLELLELKYNIACIKLQQQKYEECIPVLETLAEKISVLLGNQHPKLGSIYYSLGVAYQNRQKTKQAKFCYKNALEIWEPFVDGEDLAYRDAQIRLEKISSIKNVNSVLSKC